MALSIFSSGQNPLSLLNTNSGGTGTFASLTGKLTGSSAVSSLNVGAIGSATAVPGSVPAIQQILTPGGGTLNQVEVSQSSGQPGTTPPLTFLSDVPVTPDSYRYGNGGTASISGDNLANPRTLGELDPNAAESPGSENIASIFLSTNVPVDLNPNSSPQGNVLNAYSQFFLQSVVESQNEKLQVVETFTDYYAFFYGKRPPVYSFRGMLLNDVNYKWTNDLMFFYENFFRGTSSVQLGAQAFISYDGRLVSGFLINLNIQEDSMLQKGATFSFDVLVIDHKQVYFSDDIASLISSTTAYLNRQKARIQAQISQINASVAPGQAALKALQVTNGQLSAVSQDVVGRVTTVTPPSLATPVGTLAAGY